MTQYTCFFLLTSHSPKASFSWPTLPPVKPNLGKDAKVMETPLLFDPNGPRKHENWLNNMHHAKLVIYNPMCLACWPPLGFDTQILVLPKYPFSGVLFLDNQWTTIISSIIEGNTIPVVCQPNQVLSFFLEALLSIMSIIIVWYS